MMINMLIDTQENKRITIAVHRKEDPSDIRYICLKNTIGFHNTKRNARMTGDEAKNTLWQFFTDRWDSGWVICGIDLSNLTNSDK